MKTIIAVVGGSHCSEDIYNLAEKVGMELAHRGITIVCGGLSGVMEAVCKGARAASGHTIGILPGNSRDEANPYVEVPIVTNLGWARNFIVAKSARAVIAIDGSYGTLSEIACALQEHIPVVGLRTWSISLEGTPDNSIFVADSPKEAVDKALELAYSS